MSLADLPPELLGSIAKSLALDGPLAPFACISKSWQYAVESLLFSSLRLTSEDLDFLDAYVATSSSLRRSVLKSVDFTVVLPTYDRAACARFEQEQDRQANNAVFSEAMQRLFAALKSCDEVEQPGPMRLGLPAPYSPGDAGHRKSEKDNPGYLGDRRYEQSYLALLAGETLPELQRIRSFAVFAATPRYVEPSAAVALAIKMPGLEKVMWQLWDGERMVPKLRKRLRLDLASALLSATSALKMLKDVEFKLQHEGPCNESFTNADVSGDSTDIGVDQLSQSLKKLLQTSSLVNISLQGPICIGRHLFDGDLESGATDTWPNLQEFRMSFSIVRPDGGWYFERDPSAPSWQSDDDEEPHHGGWSESTGSDLEDSESFEEADSDELQRLDIYDENKASRLQGFEPAHYFRTQPNEHLSLLLKAMAQSVLRMPSLRIFAAGADIQPCPRTDYNPQTFEFEYAVLGTTNWKDQTSADEGSDRLYWTVPTGWRMGETLEKSWRRVLDEDGIVRYEEW
ncbi:hypothetical protein B0A50_05304 [Salinomyces thailandicus]|uniref:F-box domain-containing protein n=1 Tax=Salinomyces thailandicus TaxID=706561 RepID=A0A4U0TW17_9PEZI|nr:hypothetical protein B0A50_05304 [Salinomyces thailandica]